MWVFSWKASSRTCLYALTMGCPMCRLLCQLCSVSSDLSWWLEPMFAGSKSWMMMTESWCATRKCIYRTVTCTARGQDDNGDSTGKIWVWLWIAWCYELPDVIVPQAGQEWDLNVARKVAFYRQAWSYYEWWWLLWNKVDIHHLDQQEKRSQKFF